MGGFLALLFLGVVVAAASRVPSSPPAIQSGPFHWHVPDGGKRKFYLEPVGTSSDGYPVLRCPFEPCGEEYVKRN
jgi:hypothetical protein